jgi:nucleoside phosphorylase
LADPKSLQPSSFLQALKTLADGRPLQRSVSEKASTFYKRPTEESEHSNEQSKNILKPLDTVEDFNTRVLIVSALSQEHEAVKRNVLRRQRQPVDQIRKGGNYLDRTVIRKSSFAVDVYATCMHGMGMVPAAILTSTAIISVNPKIVFMAGICAGVPDATSVGDIVIGTDIFDYGVGKVTPEKTQPDYPHVVMSQSMGRALNAHLSISSVGADIHAGYDFEAGKPPQHPKIKLGYFASGAAVVADAQVMASIREHQRSLLALYMEAYGVAKATQSSGGIELIIAKSVSDHAGADKLSSTAASNSVFREYCCYASATVIADIILGVLPDYFSLNKPE